MKTEVKEFNISRIKLLVRGLYDAQKLRIQLELRIQRLIREKIMTQKEADAFFELPFSMFKKAEDAMAKSVARETKDHPIIKAWLGKVPGIGPRLAGLLVANIAPIERFATSSKLWAYAGLHVKDGKAVKRVKGQNSNWNQELKTTAWKISQSLIKQDHEYRKRYDEYKARIIEREVNKGNIVWGMVNSKKARIIERELEKGNIVWGIVNNKYVALHGLANDETEHLQVWKKKEKPDWTLMRVNNMALRKIAKMLLCHLWEVWRKLEDLPLRDPYCVEYLGHDRESLSDPWDYVK